MKKYNMFFATLALLLFMNCSIAEENPVPPKTFDTDAVVSNKQNSGMWIEVIGNDGKKVYLDKDTIISKPQGIFFNMYVPETMFESGTVYTIHVNSAGNAGVSRKLEYSKYITNPDNFLPENAPNAQYFKEFNKTSPGYKAFLLAKNRIVNPVDNSTDLNVFEDYIKELQEKIFRNLVFKKGYDSQNIVVCLKIKNTGELLDAKIRKSSGYAAVDNEALSVVKDSAPFAKFPSNATNEYIEINFTFSKVVFINVGFGNSIVIQAKNEVPVNINKYFNSILKSIAYYWNPTVETGLRNTTVLLTISPYGNVISSKITTPSESEKFDQKVLSSIKKASPFEPFPQEYCGNSLDLEITFISDAKNLGHSILMHLF